MRATTAQPQQMLFSLHALCESAPACRKTTCCRRPDWPSAASACLAFLFLSPRSLVVTTQATSRHVRRHCTVCTLYSTYGRWPLCFSQRIAAGWAPRRALRCAALPCRAPAASRTVAIAPAPRPPTSSSCFSNPTLSPWPCRGCGGLRSAHHTSSPEASPGWFFFSCWEHGCVQTQIMTTASAIRLGPTTHLPARRAGDCARGRATSERPYQRIAGEPAQADYGSHAYRLASPSAGWLAQRRCQRAG